MREVFLSSPASLDDELYAGLQELGTTFPKRCATCGRIYRDMHDYLTQTGRVASGASGLKQTLDDDGNVIVAIFRNCVCGSTLMDECRNRRDVSEAGRQRRERFGVLVEKLVANGIARPVARAELLKLLRGEPSTLLKRYARKDREED